MAEPEAPSPAEADFRFLTLVMSLTTAAWSQLGKMPHPSSQKIEKDLTQAQMTIDFLRMLREKTQGNLKPKEQELMDNVLSDLELNFADEVKAAGKDKASSAPEIIVPSGASKGPEILKP